MRLELLMPDGPRFAMFSFRQQKPAPELCSAEEQALVVRLAAGDHAAISEVYRAHQAALRAFAQRITGDHTTAEDLVHDVFVQLPALARKFRGHSRFSTFITGVAARLGERHVRSAMRRRAQLARLSLETSQQGQHTTGERGQAFSTTVQRALDALPMAQRMAFVLCEVEERSADEVGQILGIPGATVRTRCFHARRKLRERLERALPEAELALLGVRAPTAERESQS